MIPALGPLDALARLGGRTRLYLLLGRPVAHSLSPLIMNRAFAWLGIDAAYAALDVAPAALPAAVRGLAALGIAGANVTHPHKEAVLAGVARRSERVRLLGAANTLVPDDDGLTAHNTDAPGTALALRDLGGIDPAGARVAVFGAGGAARAAALGLLEAGAADVAFLARRPDAARAAVAPLVERFGRAPVTVVPLANGTGRGDAPDRRRREDAVGGADILVQATTVGMAPAERPNEAAPPASTGPGDSEDHAGRPPLYPLLDEPDWIGPGQVCLELAYGHGETPFLRLARRRGARSLDGHALLVAQAHEALRIWTGRTFDLRTMAEVVAGRVDLAGDGAADANDAADAPDGDDLARDAS